MIKKLSRKDLRSVRLLLPGPARKEFKNAARKGTNLARKGKYSSTLWVAYGLGLGPVVITTL